MIRILKIFKNSTKYTIDASPCYFGLTWPSKDVFWDQTLTSEDKKPYLLIFLSMQDFSLIFAADLKHVTMVFSKILPQNQLNSDTDLSVQRKPICGSSLFGIASFDTIRRNWDSLCSLEITFNCGNFICKYYWMFLIFSGYFQQRW